MKHIVLTLFMIPLFFSSETKDTYPPIVVLELFTSQGCSSCPPADELLTKIQNGNSGYQVIALSYHVDYWNYIGWKDPFSKSTYSDKQRLYSRKFNSSSIYTPQVVINGQEHFVGSNAVEMNSKLKQYTKVSSENKIEITIIDKIDNEIIFNYDIKGELTNKLLRTVLVIEERITEIPRGENRNRTLKNSNIVVAEQNLKLQNPKGLETIRIPSIVNNTDKLRLITIIQNSDFDIIGANQLKL